MPSTSDMSKASSSEIISTDSFRIEEKDELTYNHVGSIIGKGGDMVHDLQARSGCLIIVDEADESIGQPTMITYRGRSTDDIIFAKSLVSMLCKQKAGDELELPLGQATMKQLQVHANDVGRIIGKRGKMINELQIDSRARIQIDRRGKKMDGRLVIITGTEGAVVKAEKMIKVLLNIPIAYSKSSKSRTGKSSSTTTTTTSSSLTTNSIPRHIDTTQYQSYAPAPYQQQQYPQLCYYPQPHYPEQSYYYDPNYGWVATATAVDGQLYPYNPAD